MKKTLMILLVLCMVLTLGSGLNVSATEAAEDVLAVSEDYKVTYTEPTPSQDGTYVIHNEEEMESFLKSIADGNTYEGKDVVLDADLDFTRLHEKYVLNFYAWSDLAYDSGFNGHFDGQDHTISNMVVYSTKHRGGLFRTVRSGAVIENLAFENVRVEGRNEGGRDYAALIGFVNGTVEIKNVIVRSGEISGYKYIGGIVGEIGGDGKVTISGCSNYASVTAKDSVAGGIVGFCNENARVVIENCDNNAPIESEHTYAGGIAGCLEGDEQPYTVYGCLNYGAVTGGDAGGIVGGILTDSDEHSVTYNRNLGSVNGNVHAGGIIGLMEGGGDLTHNYSNADITASKYAGGIVGEIHNQECDTDNHKVYGKISAKYKGYVCGWDGYHNTSVGSFLSSGNVYVIIGGAAVILAAVVTAVLVVRKKKKAQTAK